MRLLAEGDLAVVIIDYPQMSKLRVGDVVRIRYFKSTYFTVELLHPRDGSEIGWAVMPYAIMPLLDLTDLEKIVYDIPTNIGEAA